ncbi:MAG: serine/threonine-protein kinase [Phycisphaerae bacterium]
MGRAANATAIEIPNYRLIKRVGRGAFGEVWVAEEVLTRIYRAVKVIPAAGSAKQRVELEGVRQYQQRSHGHPHLLQVLTVGETPEAVYYVMEAADNALGSRAASPEDYEPMTLAGVLERDGRMTIDAALSHVTAMLQAVDHLHRHGLAHRDIKPQNVLFVDGELKLADVGLATHDASGHAGTPGYRTPEGTPDDLYATGVVLYQMISGQAAACFPELPADLDRTHDRRQLKQVVRLVNQACHPEADQRFESPTQFVGAVQRARDVQRIRTRRIRATLIGGAVVLFGLALFWLVPVRQDAREWTDVEFVAAMPFGEWRTFATQYRRPTRFRLDHWGFGREGYLILTGAFEVGFAGSANDIMVLMLAVGDEILHVIYYDKPGEEGLRREFKNRTFRLRNALLRQFVNEQPCPVFVVLAPTDDFFGFCDEYARGHYSPEQRLLIGHIRRRAGS